MLEIIKNDEDNLEFHKINTITVTLLEPLIEEEAIILIEMLKMLKADSTVNESGRIITIESDKFPEIVSLLASFGLTEDIGMIRHSTEYYPTNKPLHNGERLH